MKALVVEDEMVVARHLSRVLEEIGYTVPATALTAQEALAMVDRHGPDIVLIDILLKGEHDGIDLAHRLRAEHGLPFLFVTSHADRATVQRARATQPSGYLVKPFKKEEVYAAIEMAMSHCAEEAPAAEPEREASSQAQGGLPPYRMNEVKTFVQKHLDEDLALADLAEVADLSKYYFSRLFKQSMGMTPYRYVMQQRVEEAGRLLMQTGLSITRIALHTGFSSQSHLSKAFKKHVGTSPSAYRRGTREHAAE